MGKFNFHTDGRDIFNLGDVDLMHEYLDRMKDFKREVHVPGQPSQTMPLWVSLYLGFTPESYATMWMALTKPGRTMRHLCELKLAPFRWNHQRSHPEHRGPEPAANKSVADISV